MNDAAFPVVVAAGSHRSKGDGALVTVPHRWTRAGIEVHGELSGPHTLHLAVAVSVLDDIYREANALGITVHGVRVHAAGGFDDAWASTGIEYAVNVDCPDLPDPVPALLERVDRTSGIPRALRHAIPVSRAPRA